MSAEELERELDAVIGSVHKMADTFKADLEAIVLALMAKFEASDASDTVKIALVGKLEKAMDAIGERLA